MKEIKYRYIINSVFVIFILSTGINNAIANSYFEHSSLDSNYKLPLLKFLYGSKICTSSNNYNKKVISDIPDNINSLNKNHLNYGDTDNKPLIFNSLFSPVIYKGHFRLADYSRLLKLPENNLFSADYIYKVTSIISERLLKIKLSTPEPGKLILLLAGLGLVCLQISSNTRKLESSYLS